MFGSNTSAQNFEPIAKSRTILAQQIFEHEDCDLLIKKYSNLISSVQFDNSNHLEPSHLVPAKPCVTHKVIKQQDGSLHPPIFYHVC